MNPEELLRQAWRLVEGKDGGPSDSDLRRAVSAGYYAVFHMLADDAVAWIAPAGPKTLRFAMRRTISHAQVKRACDLFNRPLERVQEQIKDHLDGCSWAELVELAQAVPELQEARHRADYDASALFDIVETTASLMLAERSRTLWLALRHTPDAAVFLAVIMFGEKLGKRG